MIRSRSTPTGSRSYAEELEIIQRKRADKAMKRYPISPEGPRASDIVRTINYIMFQNYNFLCTVSYTSLPQQQVEERSPEQSRRGHHFRRGTQSVPEERIPSPRTRETSRYVQPKSQVDPAGKTAANFRTVPSREPSPARQQRLADLEALQKERQQLLQQQMRQQQMQMHRQLYEQQMQRQRKLVEQQRRSVSSRKSLKADESYDPYAVAERTKPKIHEHHDHYAVADQFTRKNPDIYDQYTSAESTSGYSLYSDKYRSIGASEIKAEPPGKSGHRTGALLGKGRFTTPVGVAGLGVGTLAGYSVAKGDQIQEVDINISQTCPEDFMETLFMPPIPPTMEEQAMISDGVRTMTIASRNAIAEDDCGVITLPDENTIMLPKQDWYGEMEPLAQETFIDDFVHTLWTCR